MMEITPHIINGVESFSYTKKAHYETHRKIAQLRAENDKLRAALKPFADIAAQFEFADDNEGISGVLLGDLRAAAAALKETGND